MYKNILKTLSVLFVSLFLGVACGKGEEDKAAKAEKDAIAAFIKDDAAKAAQTLLKKATAEEVKGLLIDELFATDAEKAHKTSYEGALAVLKTFSEVTLTETNAKAEAKKVTDVVKELDALSTAATFIKGKLDALKKAEKSDQDKCAKVISHTEGTIALVAQLKTLKAVTDKTAAPAAK